MFSIILKGAFTRSCLDDGTRMDDADIDMAERGPKPNSGFTLVEMIVSLVILGILIAVIAAGIVQAVNSFIFVTGTQAVVENAELAMLRLSKELAVTQKSTITGTANSLTFSSLHQGADATYTASLSQSQLILQDNNGNNYVLGSNINSLSFVYYDSYNGAPNTTWSSTRRIVHISITVTGPSGSLLTFNTSVAPRN